MRRAFHVAAAAAVLAAANAEAGTGVYDMSSMIGAAHPFAATPGALPPAASRPTLPAGDGVGLYDMAPFLNQPHPFAGTAPQMPPVSEPPAPRMASPAMPPDIGPAPPMPRSGPPSSRPAPGPPSMVRAPAARDAVPRGQPAPPGRVVQYTRVGREASEQFYMGAQLGLSVIQESENSGSGLAFTAESEVGVSAGGTVGVEFPNGLRVEFELAWRRAAADTLNITQAGALGTGTGPRTADGSVSAMAMMFNGAWGFDVGGRMKPYVLGGLGMARVEYGDVKANGVSVVDDSAIVAAWQIGAGATVEVGERWLLDLSYRLFSTLDPTLVDVNGTSFDAEFTSHEVLAGLRYLF